MSNLEAIEYKPFEAIKHLSDDGSEFWNACKNSGYEVVDHFAEVSKIVEAGATSKPIVDYKLTRYACS